MKLTGFSHNFSIELPDFLHFRTRIDLFNYKLNALIFNDYRLPGFSP